MTAMNPYFYGAPAYGPMMPAPVSQAAMPYANPFGYAVQPVGFTPGAFPTYGAQQQPMRNAFGY